jgi:hypothetical protein
MPAIDGDLVTATEDVVGCGDLDGFSCGDGRIDAEAEVDGIVEDYVNDLLPDAIVRVTREQPSNRVVGLTAVEYRGVEYEHPLFEMDDWKGSVYLAVLTLAVGFRGSYVSKDGVPLSHVLMKDILNFLATRNDGVIPPVEAAIARDNGPSLALARHFGFNPIPTLGYALYMRPRGLAIQ